MLRYLAGVARSETPVASRRAALLLYVATAAALIVAAVFVLAVMKPAGQALTFGVVVFSLLALYALTQVPTYCLPRWIRERVLAKRLGTRVHSVYLSPELLSYLNAQNRGDLGPFQDSVSLVVNGLDLEFWSAGVNPRLAGVMAVRDIHSVEFTPSNERFLRPVLEVQGIPIPLYPATGLLALSRLRSHELLEFLRAATTL